MRSDMAKVIVERPRYGSCMPSKKKGYRRAWQRTSIDDLPKHEPMLGRWHGMQRRLNENLGPMRRFLRSCVGRPWNKVHQELCEHVSFDNAVQKHVLAHVFQYVSQHVVLRGEDVFERRQWGVHELRLRPGEMYICPKSGLLKVVRKSRRQRPVHRLQVAVGTQYQWRDNAWWEVVLRKFPDDPGELWDVWLEKDVARLSAAERQLAYGGNLIAISKRPLRRAEVRQLYRRLRKGR